MVGLKIIHALTIGWKICPYSAVGGAVNLLQCGRGESHTAVGGRSMPPQYDREKTLASRVRWEGELPYDSGTNSTEPLRNIIW